MSPLHLLWIVPLSTLFGFVFGSIIRVGKESEGKYE